MQTRVITIPANKISDWETFHDVFAKALGFPAYYGRNMDAWIDCMLSADVPDDRMLSETVEPGGLLALRLDDAASFADRCPEQFKALIDCTAFVDHARLDDGKAPVLSLLLAGHFGKPCLGSATCPRLTFERPAPGFPTNVRSTTSGRRQQPTHW